MNTEIGRCIFGAVEYSAFHPGTQCRVLKTSVPYDLEVDAGPIAQMVLQHHERLDGSGCPQGLEGEQILPGARILGVADVVETMPSHRPHRSGLGIDTALEEGRHQRGRLFDAPVVDACLTLFRERGHHLPL